MNWNKKYIVTKSAVIQINSSGTVIALASISSEPVELSNYSIMFLLKFSKGSTPLEVLSEIRENYELSKVVFASYTNRLIKSHLLIPFKSKKYEKVNTGFASVLTHHNMLKDSLRVLKYKSVIDKYVKSKTVVEIGCGSGILSLFAAKAGAKKVIAIEETSIEKLARKMISKNKLSNNIELVNKNSKDVNLDNKVDIIIHEIIGSNIFNEDILSSIVDAKKRFLKRGGLLIPFRLKVCCIGFEIDVMNHYMLEVKGFEQLYGLDFTHFSESLKNTNELNLNTTGAGQQFKMITNECIIHDINFQEDFIKLKEKKTVKLTVSENGKLGGVYIYFIAYLDKYTKLSNSPFTPFTSWGRDVKYFSQIRQVRKNQKVRLQTNIEVVNGRTNLKVLLPKV